VSANELALTILLRLDGSQASTDLPRLTAQIASKLQELNKPNDGAAAAAIASQKTLGQQTVAVQQQTNATVLKQMDAMWAARDKQQADALQREIGIEKAFGSQRAATAQSVEKEIAAAFQAREKELTKSAAREAAAWAEHEKQKLSTIKQAEKEGEAAVAQSNANRERVIKASLANATRAASQSAASQIRSQLQTAQAAVDSNSLIEKSLSSLGSHFNLFIGSRIPVAGGAFIRLTENVKGFLAISKESEGSVLRLGNIIAGIATKTGKPISEIKSFLQTTASLGTQIEKDEAAIKTFGPALAQSLIPQLARADAEIAALTASTSEAGAGFAALAGPIGIAVVAVAALVVAVGLAEKKMFDLAEASAKVEGRFVDLSQQTGISTELLSGFDVLASTTGTSLEALSASFGIFQKHLEEARDPMSNSAGLLNELGIQTLDTESALRQSFAVLARMPEGYRQTALALELFGRGGKSVLAIIKETNGDLDTAIKRFRDLGLIVSEEDAKAADKFNDELEILNRQITDLEVELGKQFLPAALDIVVAFGDLIKSSRDFFNAIGFIGKPAIQAFADELKLLSLAISVVNKDFETTAKIVKDFEDRELIKPLNVPEISSLIAPLPTALQNALHKSREDIRLVRAEVSEAVRFAESQIAAIDRQLQSREISPAQALEPIIASERAKTEAVVKGLEAQREARAKEFTKDQADREKQADDIQAIDQQISNEQERFQKFEADKRAEFRAQELQREQTHRRRILDIFLSSLNDRVAALERSTQAGINSELFAQNVTVELLKVGFDRRKQVLEQERREAGKDPALVRQINAQLLDLQRERTATLSEQSDRRIQILRSEAQKDLDLQRQTINSLLRATEIVDESRIASIRALVDLRVKSEQQAAREILAIRLAEIDQQRQLAHAEREVIDQQITSRLDAFSKQREALNKELNDAGAIKDPIVRNVERNRIADELIRNVNAEIDAQKKANKDRADADTELNNKLRVLNAQRSQIEADGERDIEEARQKDLTNARRYSDELDRINERTVEIQQDTEDEMIRLMEIHFASRKDLIRAQREFDLREERLRHERVTSAINRQRAEVDEQIRILELHLKAVKVGTQEEIDELERLRQKLEELKQTRDALQRQQEAEDQRSKTRGEVITTKADKEIEEADPLGRLKIGKEQIKEFASELEASIVPINQLLADSFHQVSDAIGETVSNWVLLGETGPAIGRKILAQALANLAKEATVNALKETALGFATLFFNPAESAAHFTAAGIWAAVAGGSALLGRSVAGDLFKQKSTSAGGSSSSSQNGQLNPITQNRNQPQVQTQVIRHEHVFRIESNDAHIVKVLSKEIRRAGDPREMILNDGQT
jgi:hypothetical protein